MKYVIGIDLGTSAVKVLLINQQGEVVRDVSKSYPVIQEKSGYSEQIPEDWVEQTKSALKEIVSGIDSRNIEGISFSGQMHGLVLVDEHYRVLRNAILWNDTRTTEQCQTINELVGEERLLAITKNSALEGFTLPKLLWVKEHEPEILNNTRFFLLPKDYLRFRLTGKIHTDYSDAAGTLMMDVVKKEWSEDIMEATGLDSGICPPLVDSGSLTGSLTAEVAAETGLPEHVKVFAGGADNACGAVGSGILEEGKTLCSIGTSGVVLSYETSSNHDFGGKVHYFNHSEENVYYTMGVTLAAGYSLSWFKDVFAGREEYEELLKGIQNVPVGARGLLFTPYIAGERTPHADSAIRGSFIGVDASHNRQDFVRAVIEGITFSLNDSVQIFSDNGKEVNSIISIGGGAKNPVWLQIQADIFNAEVHKLSSEQGPGLGAAMLAAVGAGWYPSLRECSQAFTKIVETYTPIEENVKKYKELYTLYTQVYQNTKSLNEGLSTFR